MDDVYWKAPDGPVIINICGEYTCSGVMDTRQFPLVLAQQNNALVLSVEHRFYGESQLFPETPLATQNLRFLSTSQALADLANFLRWYQEEKINAVYNKTTNNKFFILGGSYPGAMSAWFRLKYPHLSVGALSSSGVVNSILDFSGFDAQVHDSALSTPQCVEALQQATAAVESQMPAVKALFDASELSDGDFYYLIADAVGEGVQYGHREEACNQMVDALNNQRDLAVQLANYTTQFFYAAMGNTAADYDSNVLANPNYNPDHAGRQWWWQTCSELAYFNTAPASDSIRSRHVNLDYFHSACGTMFPEFPVFPPDTDAVNAVYGGAQTDATNIIFTNGLEDPWRRASVAPPPAKLPSDSETSILIDCPQCAHCIDLHTPLPTDPPTLSAARDYVSKQVAQWLLEGKPASF